MRWSKTVTLVEAHAEGEVGRVVTGGVIDVPGDTMLAKLSYLNETDDSLRKFLVNEPRGCAQMSTNLLLKPCDPNADAGLIILQGDKAHAMSGSNCICFTTVLLETGILQMKEPETVVTIDTPAGLVKATAKCSEGKCKNVQLDMTPCFASQLNAVLNVPEVGNVQVDVVFGGIFYALVDIAQFGLNIIPENARELVRLGSAIHRAANQKLEVIHPESSELNGISYVMFIGYDDEGRPNGATIMPPGRVDRSPCGTGNSARLAAMYARGEVDVGHSYEARSIIDSCFKVELMGTTISAGQTAILPRITGRGWIHGIHQIGVDPSDPYPYGFMMADCWGDAFDLVK